MNTQDTEHKLEKAKAQVERILVNSTDLLTYLLLDENKKPKGTHPEEIVLILTTALTKALAGNLAAYIAPVQHHHYVEELCHKIYELTFETYREILNAHAAGKIPSLRQTIEDNEKIINKFKTNVGELKTEVGKLPDSN